jgi:hypothetical protein
VSHFAVSIELSLKLSLTIGAARAPGNVIRVQIDATTIREKTMRALVVILCEAKTLPRGADITTSLKWKTTLF